MHHCRGLCLVIVLASTAMGADARPPGTWLTTLDVQKAEVVRGSAFGKDGLIGKGPATIRVVGASDTSHSLCAFAPSRLEYDLQCRFHRLTGSAAIDDSAQFTKWTKPAVIFHVRGDGKDLWTSDLVVDKTPRAFAVDVTGVQVLELSVETPQAPKNLGQCRSVWVEPLLSVQSQALTAAQQAYRRAQDDDKAARLGKAVANYEKAARAGGLEPFALIAADRATELRDQRHADLSAAMEVLDRGDAAGAVTLLDAAVRTWGESDEARALLRQARDKQHDLSRR